MSDYGKLVDQATFTIERQLPGPIERVWAYLVEPEKRAQWFCAGVFELHSGGRAEFLFDHRRITPADDRPPKKYDQFAGESRLEGKILKAEPPRLLVFEWPEMSGESTKVTIELAPQDDKVWLKLTHEKLEKRDSLISASAGWHAHLDILKAKLEGAASPRFWAAHTRLEMEYDKRIPA